MSTIARSTVSFTEQNWEYLKEVSNRSRFINQDLEYYFKAQAFIKTKEEEFLLSELNDYQQNPQEGKKFSEVFGEPL
jgi:hypothetical protein